MRKSNRELNRLFIQKFLESPLIKAASMTLPFKHKWNKLLFTEKLVFLRNKMVQKNISLTVDR